MAKPDNPSQSDSSSTRSYQDQGALVAAIKDLAAAIAASRAEPGPSNEARAAGAQYREIKGALRRFFEVGAPTPATGSSGTATYE